MSTCSVLSASPDGRVEIVVGCGDNGLITRSTDSVAAMLGRQSGEKTLYRPRVRGYCILLS